MWFIEPLAPGAGLVAESGFMRHRKFLLRKILLACLVLSLATAARAAALHAQDKAKKNGAAASPAAEKTASEKRGVAIVQHGGYPELQVNGHAFFIYSAAFFYARIPRNLWESSLDRYRDLGINTIDLYIPWNWHEPREGEFDFDGHTNPRRDLRGLLQILARKGFRCIARPGPTILNEWRHGGYPDWLLERPEYAMAPLDRIEGRYPPLSNLNARDAEAAARGWLENPVHMAYARKWLTAVAREFAPYRASETVTLPEEGKNQPRELRGPLLFMQLEDDLALGRSNTAGPMFWCYMETLRGFLEAGGLDVPAFINPDDTRVSAAGSGLARPIGTMGQWYLQPSRDHLDGERILNAEDASTLEFFTEELKTQPSFPPVMIEYQAGWYAPGDDTRPPPSPASNTLLSTRLLLAHGLHGLNHFPLQDTLFPAGYETPWTNRHYRWDAALSLNGFRQARARAVERTGDFLALWGGFLAASHKRADFGLIYPLGSFPQEALGKEEIAQVSGTILRLERLAHLAGLASELLDPEYQPVEQLLRHPIILLPVFDSTGEKFQMSERSQRVLVEYVRRGGFLIAFPAPPQGAVVGELWKARPAQPRQLPSGGAAWLFGAGQVIAVSKDFYSWVVPGEDFAASRKRLEADWAINTLRGFFTYARIQSVVERLAHSRPASALVVAELASNEGTGVLGARTAGTGLLSVTNMAPGEPVETFIEVLSPRAGVSGDANEYLPLRLTLPPRESLLLPIHFSLCSAAPPGTDCDDEVALAGAELLRAERDAKTLELTFYVPARATVRLRLRQRPAHVSLEDAHLDAKWSPDGRELEVEIPRGAAPDFLRVLKVHMHYTPGVPPRPEPGHAPPLPRHLLHYSAVGALRLPLGEDTSLLTDPPLFAVSGERNDSIVLAAENLDNASHDVDFHVEGPLSGSAGTAIPAHEWRSLNLKLRQEKPANPPGKATPDASGPGALIHEDPFFREDSLLREEMTVSSGGEHTHTPVYFVVVPEKGAVGYRFDFDRDANPEWVLENSGLRLILSPEEGGRAVALVDKAAAANLATTIGLFADHFAFTPNPPGINPARAHGRYGLFNRLYRAEWLPEEAGRALRLSYRAPDVAPAGARIEKTIRLLDAQRFAVDYDVVLDAAADSRLDALGRPTPTGAVNPFAAPLPEGTRQAFVAVNSVPAHAGGEQSTRFCWPAGPGAGEGAAAGAAPPAGVDPPPEHCEAFVAGRDPLTIPASAARLEVRTPGRPSLVLAWKNARMTVEMKNYSALLRLEFHPLEPGGAPIRPRIEFTVRGND